MSWSGYPPQSAGGPSLVEEEGASSVSFAVVVPVGGLLLVPLSAADVADDTTVVPLLLEASVSVVVLVPLKSAPGEKPRAGQAQGAMMPRPSP